MRVKTRKAQLVGFYPAQPCKWWPPYWIEGGRSIWTHKR